MENKKILIVDDEEDVLLMLKKRLNSEGFSVATATTARALAVAIDVEKPGLPDLIIMDIGLPDIDGREIVKKLKKLSITQNIPVIYLTALFSKEDEIKMEGMLDGCVMFTKPYDRGQLLNAIHQLLNNEKINITN